MAWRAVHPSITEPRRIPSDDPTGPVFTLGFWPPLEAEKAKIYVSKVRRASGGTDIAELVDRARVDLDAFWSMARFGVRGWSGLGDLVSATERVSIDGREHVALSDDSMQVLYHSGLLLPVALECWRYNSLTDEEKKTSNSPSRSITWTSDTPATDATSDSAPVTSGEASFGSMDVRSPAAPTS